jgi:hypothetical protein
MKKRVYSATDIMHVDWHKILEPRRSGEEAVVGVDVGKLDMRAVLRWPDGSFERPWAVANPAQIGTLVNGVGELARDGRRVRVAMESTGTYGDALRQALADAGVEAHLVSGKRAHDYAEVFDGVPSQHDGKDAAVVAELCALGKSLAWPWPPPDEQVGQLMFLVDQLEVATRAKTAWVLRLEAMLARHWPEASRVLKPGGGTMLRALAHYGGPVALAAEPGRGGDPAALGHALARCRQGQAGRRVGARDGGRAPGRDGRGARAVVRAAGAGRASRGRPLPGEA